MEYGARPPSSQTLSTCLSGRSSMSSSQSRVVGDWLSRQWVQPRVQPRKLLFVRYQESTESFLNKITCILIKNISSLALINNVSLALFALYQMPKINVLKKLEGFSALVCLKFPSPSKFSIQNMARFYNKGRVAVAPRNSSILKSTKSYLASYADFFPTLVFH